MQLVLETQPAFLRKFLSQSRNGLLGVGASQTQPILAMDLPLKSQNKPKEKFFLKLTRGLLLFIFVISLVIAGVLVIPDTYYRFFPADVAPLATLEKTSPLGGDFDKGANSKLEVLLPPKSDSLPEGNWLVIPRIGVRTEIRPTADPAEALQNGVWMAPDYGKPGDEFDLPIILAAHRFGWDWWWQTDYWKYHSFYNLPDVQPGDLIEVIADKRKWVYEVYAGEEGQEITDYDADMILYTCKFLNSPVRHFRYARLVELDLS